MMLVVAARPRSSSALRNCARLSSAFLMPAIEVGPLIPGVMVLRLSPVLCWLPSGSRDQNTSTNGLLRALNIGSTTLAGDVGHIGLLRDVGDRRARRLGVARLAVFAARGCRQRQIGLGQRVLHFIRQRNAVLAAGGIVDHDRMQASAPTCRYGRRSGSGRACRWRPCCSPWRAPSSEWFPRSDSRRRNARRCRRDRSFSRNGVTVSPAGRDGIAGVDRVAEIAGIAEIMAGRHCRARWRW